MRGLASLLLLMVVVTHYAYEPIAEFYSTQQSARAVFYVLRGIEGTLLYCIVWALTPYKPLHIRFAVSAVCAWGALEEAQTAVCRIAVGIDNHPDTKQYHGLCDMVTGVPIYMLTLLVVLLIFAWGASRKRG